jgi:hypothetical protein
MQFIWMSALLTLLVMPGFALAHPARPDKNGCHNDKKAGDHHCHTVQMPGRLLVKRDDAKRARQASLPPSPHRTHLPRLGGAILPRSPI